MAAALMGHDVILNESKEEEIIETILKNFLT